MSHIVFRIKFLSELSTKKSMLGTHLKKNFFWPFNLEAFGALHEFSRPFFSLFTTI
jgi:hypothetical protein